MIAGIAALLKAGFELVYPPRPVQLTEEELLQELRGVSASLAGSEPYTARVLAAHPQLRIIARAGVGYDAVDVTAATAQGIVVTITPGTNQEAVAEHTFAMMLGLAKKIATHHHAVKAGQWPRQANLPLRGKALGIAGLGRIGKAVALRGACFGMKLLAHEPFPDARFVAEHGVTLMPFDRLLAESDYVTLHLPLTLDSKYLINRYTLALMKPTAFLINTARGGLVCEADLFEALAVQTNCRSRPGCPGAGAAHGEDTALFAGEHSIHTAHGGYGPAIARRHGPVGRGGDCFPEPGRVARGQSH